METIARLRAQLLTAIDTVMEKEGITQTELAERIGAQQYNVNKVLRRKLATSIDFLLKMAESCDLEVELKIKRGKG
jgi:predicted XRE-type DNA-binding protein